MQFIDEVKIHVHGGDGGNGVVAFRREKFVPRGGPSGGDGGHGGSVILVADTQLGTLLDLRYQQHYLGKRGEHGQGRDRYGKGGEDSLVRVPVGTLIRDAATGEILADLVTAGDRFVAGKGGKGGRGNIHFATSTNQAPRTAEDGEPGEERTLRLELKLLADVGLLGFPNVGKSTFIARVSRARPKIADYPFTTLIPNLGVVGLSDERSFVLADIPGLIEGAAEGHGLGHRFLRHVERTSVLLHLVELPMGAGDGNEREPLHDFDIINRELARYDPALATRPQVVALSKLDLTETREAYPALRAAFAKRGVELHALSAVTGEGMPEILERLWAQIATARARPA
ncbi:MAG: GTPase ObgE [Myxococcales bacterium]|nr:GTPase ObgE [Myxococcales bacterium]